MLAEFQNTPAFAMDKTRFDMTTFDGRLAHFFQAVDPRLCLENEASIEEAQAILAAFQADKLDRSKITDSDLWLARRKIDACVHPVTKQVIPWYLRFCAFMPMNIFIVPPMMVPQVVASPMLTTYFHWLNQTYNCGINYANRASDEQPISILMQAYGAAVGVSLTVALSATAVMKRIGGTPGLKSTLIRAVFPCFACGFSGGANVALMRQSEWNTDGVPVTDEDGQVRGFSKAAGWQGIKQCATARVLWNMPPLLLPPLLVMPLAARFGFVRNNVIKFELLACFGGMAIGIPPGLALFPLRDTIKPSQMEPQFQNMKRKDGSPVQQFSFYKGL